MEMNVSQWPLFELDRVLEDIDQGRLLVLMKDQHVVGGVTLTETDPLIWTDNTPAFYIHRLVVARYLKGQDIGSVIVDLVEQRAITSGKSVLRLDCWANNDRLKRYYERIGFRKIRDLAMGEAPSLPAHYRNSTTTLFERQCDEARTPRESVSYAGTWGYASPFF
jgi:predicted N-acetyltransferase YhbS